MESSFLKFIINWVCGEWQIDSTKILPKGSITVWNDILLLDKIIFNKKPTSFNEFQQQSQSLQKVKLIPNHFIESSSSCLHMPRLDVNINFFSWLNKGLPQIRLIFFESVEKIFETKLLIEQKLQINEFWFIKCWLKQIYIIEEYQRILFWYGTSL